MQVSRSSQTATENSLANFTLSAAPCGLAGLKCRPPRIDLNDLLTVNFDKLANFYKGACWTTYYLSALSHVATQLGALDNQILATICIPVAGTQETQRIYRCIEALGYQTLSNERFEIALLVNYSAQDSVNKCDEIDQLFSEIDRARRDFPSLNVRTATLQFNSYEEISIGYLRSLLSDAVIERALRSSRTDDLVMLRLDADTRAVKQQLLEAHIRLYNSRPNVLSIQGGLRWSPEGLANSPEQFAQLAYFSLQSTVERHRNLVASWSGPAGSIRASAYCWIGGYDPNCHLAEDHDLTVRLFSSTPSDNQLEAVVPGGPTTNVVTSNRRAVGALERNVPVSLQWQPGPTEFRIQDCSIRQREEGNLCEPNTLRLNTGLQDLEARLACADGMISNRESEANHNYLKTKQILSREGLLARLHKAYSVEGQLVSRLLCHLPENVARFRGDSPDRIDAIRARVCDEELIRDRLERYWSPFLTWPHKIGVAVQKSIKRSKLPQKLPGQIRVDMCLGVIPEMTSDVTEETFMAALTASQALLIHVTLPYSWGKVTLALRREQYPSVDLVASVHHQPRATSKRGASNQSNVNHQIFEAFSKNMEEQLAPKYRLDFEPSRLVADRVVTCIVLPLMEMEFKLC
jgi:hypothetical protein